MMSPPYIREVNMRQSEGLDDYLYALPAVQYLMTTGGLTFSSPITFFVGENGTGKSTLLEAIAVAYGFNPEGGTINFNFSTRSSHSNLHRAISLGKNAYPKDGFFLRAESLYNVASNIDDIDPTLINSYGGISLHAQSHGESFLSVIQNRFGGNGLYLLDEPEAALSPSRLLTLMVEIDRLIKADSQLIIATHSPILMAFPNAEIFEFSKNGIRKTDYRETEHYQITKNFLDNPDRMLRYLLDS